jgi:amino acid transporter
MSTSATQPGSRIGEAAGRMATSLAAGRLGIPAVTYFVLTAATPLTVVAGVVTTGIALTGRTAMPIAFVVIGALLALWAVGYVAMARHITNAGAFYAFVAAGLGRAGGVGAAWVALAAYTALTVGLYGLVGIVVPPLVEMATGRPVPWWAAAGVCCVLVAVLGSRAVGVNGVVLGALVSVEIAIIVLGTAANLTHPAAGAVSTTALNPSELAGPGAGALLALAVLGFVGIESTTVYAEESKDRRRTVARATAWSIAILTVLYAAASWALTVAVGDAYIVERARTQGIDLFFTLLGDRFGSIVATTGFVLLATSAVAAAISFHNTTARYIFALGRENVLPGRLGRTAPRTSAPAAASLTLSAVSALVIVIVAVLGLDPLVDLFFTAGTSGGLGVLVLITVTSLAVVRYFHGVSGSVWTQRLAPALATVLLGGVATLAVAHFDQLLGVAPGSKLPLAIPVLIAAIAAAGTLWGLALRRWRPAVYERIGAGPAAALADQDGWTPPLPGTTGSSV